MLNFSIPPADAELQERVRSFVRESVIPFERGAGAGCVTPSISMKVLRAMLCGCAGASSMSSTGAKQMSVPSMRSTHSARVRVAIAAATRRLSSGHWRLSIWREKTGSPSRPSASRSSAWNCGSTEPMATYLPSAHS